MIFSSTFAAIGLVGTAVTLPGTLELATLTVASLLKSHNERRDTSSLGRLAVVVPAHDEEDGIAACVESLREAEVPACGVDIWVVADNCSDATADRAKEAGAQVLERNDPERRGKGYALELAFDHILQDAGIEAVLVVDADTRVDPGFFKAMAGAFAAGADGVQCRYLVGNPEVSSRTRLMNIALLAFNVARPKGRQNLGLSVGILGNGFGLHRRVLEVLPYTARSVVEDLEYHLMMVREGFAVRFVEETSVLADVPISEEGIRTQRERWEGGRFRMIREHGPALAKEVLGGDLSQLEPLGELLLLPLATHVGLLSGLLLVPFPPTQLYALSALGVVGAHVGAALYVGGAGPEELKALARVPLYVAKKAWMLPSLLRASRKSHDWVRTARD